MRILQAAQDDFIEYHSSISNYTRQSIHSNPAPFLHYNGQEPIGHIQTCQCHDLRNHENVREPNSPQIAGYTL